LKFLCPSIITENKVLLSAGWIISVKQRKKPEGHFRLLIFDASALELYLLVADGTLAVLFFENRHFRASDRSVAFSFHSLQAVADRFIFFHFKSFLLFLIRHLLQPFLLHIFLLKSLRHFPVHIRPLYGCCRLSSRSRR